MRSKRHIVFRYAEGLWPSSAIRCDKGKATSPNAPSSNVGILICINPDKWGLHTTGRIPIFAMDFDRQTSFIFKGSGKKISVPWFIFYFIGAIILNTYVLDGIPQLGQAISDLARKGLIITMFFIGASLSMGVLKQVGMKPLIQGVILWVVISLSTLAYILLF